MMGRKRKRVIIMMMIMVMSRRRRSDDFNDHYDDHWYIHIVKIIIMAYNCHLYFTYSHLTKHIHHHISYVTDHHHGL